MISGNVGVGLKEDINTGEYTEMIITILIKGIAIYIFEGCRKHYLYLPKFTRNN